MITGTAAKTTASTTSRAVSERVRRRSSGSRPGPALVAGAAPAIAEAGIVLECVECWIEVTEFLPNAFHHGAHVAAIALAADPGDETLAAHDVVDLAIGHVAAGLVGEQRDDVELGQGQRHLAAVPQRPAAVGAQLERAVG